MHIEQVKTGKHRFTDLLLIADPDRHMIDRYLDRGELFTLYDGEELKSVCVVTAESETLCELKNLATVERVNNPFACRSKSGTFWTFAETGFPSYRQARTISRKPSGSMKNAVSHRTPDFFTDHYPELIYEEGILLIDMIYLKQELLQVKNRPAKTSC